MKTKFANLVLIGALTCSLTVSVQADDHVLDPVKKNIGKSEHQVDVKLVAEGLTMPVWATHANDGSDRLFVIDMIGKIRLIKNGKLIDTPVLDMTKQLVKLKPNFDERGLLGIAFHPEFNGAVAAGRTTGKGRVYTYSSEPAKGISDFVINGIDTNHHSVIAEWQFDKDNPDVIDPTTRRVVMRFDQPQFNHNGGGIAFGIDGMLYIATGDGGKAHDKGAGHLPGGNGQALTTVLAKVLRIDPLGNTGKLSANKQYSVPQDNPFVKDKSAIDEIWAYGMRNPYRMSIDLKTGMVITGDIGQNMIEEVNVIKKGGNYGWPVMEGTFYFDSTAGKEGGLFAKPQGKISGKMLAPAVQYDHDDGISVIGGFVYRGKAIPALEGLYVFGEWTHKSGKSAGRLLHADLSTGLTQEVYLPTGGRIGAYVTGFGEDSQGELYILASGNVGPKGNKGLVYKIVPPGK